MSINRVPIKLDESNDALLFFRLEIQNVTTTLRLKCDFHVVVKRPSPIPLAFKPSPPYVSDLS